MVQLGGRGIDIVERRRHIVFEVEECGVSRHAEVDAAQRRRVVTHFRLYMHLCPIFSLLNECADGACKNDDE